MPAPDPVRIPLKTEIKRRLTEFLEGCNPDNGHDIDLRGRVFRGRNDFGDDEEGYWMTILEAPRQLDLTVSSKPNKKAGPYTLLLQGFAEDNRRHPTDPADLFAANVEERLARLNETYQGDPKYPDDFCLGLFGKGITSITPNEPIVRPPDNEVSDTAYFYLPLVIGLARDLTQNFYEEE